jgi:hypothetical protein
MSRLPMPNFTQTNIGGGIPSPAMGSPVPQMKGMGNSAIPGKQVAQRAASPVTNADPAGAAAAMQQKAQHMAAPAPQMAAPAPTMPGGMSNGPMSPVPGGQVPKLAYAKSFVRQCEGMGLKEAEIYKRAVEASLGGGLIAVQLAPIVNDPGFVKRALHDVGWGDMFKNLPSTLNPFGAGQRNNLSMENFKQDVTKYPMKTIAPAVGGGLVGGGLAAGGIAGAGGLAAMGETAGGMAGTAGRLGMKALSSPLAKTTLKTGLKGMQVVGGGYGGRMLGNAASTPMGQYTSSGLQAIGVPEGAAESIGGTVRKAVPYLGEFIGGGAPLMGGVPGLAGKTFGTAFGAPLTALSAQRVFGDDGYTAGGLPKTPPSPGGMDPQLSQPMPPTPGVSPPGGMEGGAPQAPPAAPPQSAILSDPTKLPSAAPQAPQTPPGPQGMGGLGPHGDAGTEAPAAPPAAATPTPGTPAPAAAEQTGGGGIGDMVTRAKNLASGAYQYAVNGKVDMQNPAVQDIVHEGAKSMLGTHGMLESLGTQIGGPFGEVLKGIGSLPPDVQMALAGTAFALIGGLLGGSTGALVGGAAGGLGALAMHHLPEIAAAMGLNTSSYNAAPSQGAPAPQGAPLASSPYATMGH